MTQATCETIRQRLSALIDGDLTPGERRALEEHLNGCAACEAETRAMRETSEALRNLPRAEPPPDMIARIERAIDGTGSRRARGRSRIQRHAVAMILVVGILVGIIRVIPHGPGLFGPRRPPLPAATPTPRERAEGTTAEEVAPIPDQDRAASRTRAAAPAKTPPVSAQSSAGKRDAVPAPPSGREIAMAEVEARGDLAKKKNKGALTAEPGGIGPATAGAGTAAPPGSPAIDLLRHPRPEPAWAESMRRLIQDRPEELARAWKSLSTKERSEVLADWHRSAMAPGIAGDLDAAMEKARDPDLKSMLHALREFTP